jgi:hypothetical protein
VAGRHEEPVRPEPGGAPRLRRQRGDGDLLPSRGDPDWATGAIIAISAAMIPAEVFPGTKPTTAPEPRINLVSLARDLNRL